MRIQVHFQIIKYNALFVFYCCYYSFFYVYIFLTQFNGIVKGTYKTRNKILF